MQKQFLLTGISIVLAIGAVVATVYVATTDNPQQPFTTTNTLPTSQTSKSSSALSSGGGNTSTLARTPTSTWRVVRGNLTVYYGVACIPIEFSRLSCPTMNTETHTPSLNNVVLISYQGNYYYGLNFTSYFNGQPITHTFWFTNSTVFCISPKESQSVYDACPTYPVQPTTIVLGNTTTAASVNSSIGLRLELRLSVDNVSKGSLGIMIDEKNILSRINIVTAANNWPLSPDNLKDICYGGYVIGYAVFQGNFGRNDFMKGTPLALMETNARFICQAPTPQTYYSFQPMSDNATISPGSQFPTTGSSTMPVSISASISGYWTGGLTSSTFNAFPAGNYTVVAVDEWGQVALLHFTVRIDENATVSDGGRK